MEIYDPAEDSELLRRHVRRFASGRVLDMGTGSGIQAREAAESKSVREVLAVDINPEAVKQFQAEAEGNRLKKIKVKESDLFAEVEGKFSLIIFNPPYLPQDKGIDDPALYGGKRGWEILERFFSNAGDHLLNHGRIMIIFSSLTNKDKVDELIRGKMLEAEELERKKLPFFEELYVYLIQKSSLLKKLESRGISEISYLTHGRRGDIFTGIFNPAYDVKKYLARQGRLKVAIKVKREESRAVERIKNEAEWLKLLNREKIGPRLLFSGEDYLVYEFVEGEFILDYLGKNKEKKGSILQVLSDVLGQCFKMDQMGVNKEEMHRPHKHILITGQGKAVLLDFERCYPADNPHNLTQFGDFLISRGMVEKEEMICLLQNYKRDPCLENYNNIREVVLCSSGMF